MMKLALPYGQSVTVSDLADASSVVREYTKNIGYREFYTSEKVGLVTEGDKAVARVSYNGRVWDANDKDREILV